MIRIALLLACLFAPGSFGAIAYTGHTCNGTIASGTSISLASCTAPTNGNNLYMVVGCTPSTAHVSSISETGAAWTIVKASATNRDVEIWEALNVSGASATVTVNLSASCTGGADAIMGEFSGLATSSDQDATPLANSGTSANPATSSITTVTANTLLIAGSRIAAATLSSGPTNSFSVLATPSARTQAAYFIASSAAAYSTDWTFTSSGVWDSVIGAFKISGAAPPAITGGLLLLGVGAP